MNGWMCEWTFRFALLHIWDGDFSMGVGGDDPVYSYSPMR